MAWDDELKSSRPAKSRPGLLFLDEEEAPPRAAAPPAPQPDVFVFDDGYAGPAADRSELPTDAVVPSSRLGPGPLERDDRAPEPLRRFDFDRGFSPTTKEIEPLGLGPPQAAAAQPSDNEPAPAPAAISPVERARALLASPSREEPSTRRSPARPSADQWAPEDAWNANRPAPAGPDGSWDSGAWSAPQDSQPAAGDPWTDALHDTATPAGPPRGDLGLWDEDVSEDALPPARLVGRAPGESPTEPAAPASDPFSPGGALDAAFGRALAGEEPTGDPLGGDSRAEDDPWDSDWRSPPADDELPAGPELKLGQSSLRQELEDRPLLDPQPMYLKQLDSPMLSNPPPDHSITGEHTSPTPRVSPRSASGRRLAAARPELVPLEDGEGGVAAVVKALLVASFMGVLAFASSRAWMHFVDGQPQAMPLTDAAPDGEPPTGSEPEPASAGAEGAAGEPEEAGGPAVASAEEAEPAVAELPPAPAPAPDPEPDAVAAADDEPAPSAAETRRSRAEARDQGVLTVLTDRPADVWVDGRRVGRTPMRPLRLAPGWHDVTLVAASGRRTRHEARTRIDSGQARHLALEFASLEKRKRR
jgi:hypothetical protein